MKKYHTTVYLSLFIFTLHSSLQHYVMGGWVTSSVWNDDDLSHLEHWLLFLSMRYIRSQSFFHDLSLSLRSTDR